MAIRVGSVGIGGISRGVHLPGIQDSPDLELVAVCDINPEALAYAQKHYGISPEYCFTDYHDLINCPLVEAVDISTPNCLHFPIAMAAVQAGKPYCVEKPMTMDAAEADALAKATREANVKSMVCFSYRYQPAARYIRELIRKNTLGRLYHMDMQYYQAWALPSRNVPCVWRFSQPLTGSGTLGDLGSHALDLIRFVSGQEYARVDGHIKTYVTERKALDSDEIVPVDVDDIANCMGEMTDGTAITMRSTRFGYGRDNYQMLEIYGEKGALVYKLDADGTFQNTLEVCLDPLGMENHQFIQVHIPQRCRGNQMQSFADLLLGKGDGMTATVEDGRRNMHVVDAVLRAAREGRWQKVEQ